MFEPASIGLDHALVVCLILGVDGISDVCASTGLDHAVT